MVPLLHDVEPQMVEQLVDVFSLFDQVPGQVIKVPKVIIEDIPSRRSRREPHLAEQLAEVPTILYFFKQTVDIPVLGARVRRRRDLHGFHSGQGSTEPLGAEQNVDIPGPRRGGRRLQALSIEQIVDILVPVEGLQCFRPGEWWKSVVAAFPTITHSANCAVLVSAG